MHDAWTQYSTGNGSNYGYGALRPYTETWEQSGSFQEVKPFYGYSYGAGCYLSTEYLIAHFKAFEDYYGLSNNVNIKLEYYKDISTMEHMVLVHVGKDDMYFTIDIHLGYFITSDSIGIINSALERELKELKHGSK